MACPRAVIHICFSFVSKWLQFGMIYSQPFTFILTWLNACILLKEFSNLIHWMSNQILVATEIFKLYIWCAVILSSFVTINSVNRTEIMRQTAINLKFISADLKIKSHFVIHLSSRKSGWFRKYYAHKMRAKRNLQQAGGNKIPIFKRLDELVKKSINGYLIFYV